MPSGSHGGGRGGHSFGGARFGRSSTPRFTSSHRHDNHYSPHRYIFFRRSYTAGSVTSFLVFCLVLCLVVFLTQQSKINQIKSDQLYYFNMIETAEPNQYMNAIVTNQFEGDGGKFYITYKLDISGYDLWYEDGYTYSIYTVEEASEIFRRGEIRIVVDRLPLTRDTDSINADYMNFDLSDDGSYIEATRLRTTVLIIGGILILAIIGSSSYYLKNKYSQLLSDDQDTHISNQDIGINHQRKVEYCLYCGAMMTKNDTKCPHCGAGRSYSK